MYPSRKLLNYCIHKCMIRTVYGLRVDHCYANCSDVIFEDRHYRFMGNLVSLHIPIIASRRQQKDGIDGREATLANDLVQSESKFFFVACVHHVLTSYSF